MEATGRRPTLSPIKPQALEAAGKRLTLDPRVPGHGGHWQAVVPGDSLQAMPGLGQAGLGQSQAWPQLSTYM